MKLKKILPSILAIAMVLGAMGITVFAAETSASTADDFYNAVEGAQSGDVINLTGDVTYEVWTSVWNKENLTINGNGNTITITKDVDSAINGGGLLLNATNLTINDLTVNLPVVTDWSGEQPRLAIMNSGKLNNVTVTGGNYAVSVVGAGPVVIDNCNFSNICGWAVDTESKASTAELTITNSTFDENAVIIRGEKNTFTGNTIKNAGEGVNVLGNAVISGNDFGESSLGIDSGVEVTIENNEINSVQFTEWLVPADEKADYTSVTVTDNTLSAEALEALEVVITDVAENNTIATVAAKIGETEYATLEEAITAAVSGDTITLLDDVTYTEGGQEIHVPAGVTIDGNNKTITINNVLNHSSIGAFYSTGSYTMKNLTITTPNTLASGAQAVSMVNGGILENVTVSGGFSSGVYAGSNTTVTGCTFNNATYGIYAENANATGIVIENNIFGTYRAALLTGSVEFTGNTTTVNCEKGVSVNCTGETVITNNTFNGARALSLTTANDATIADNVIEGTVDTSVSVDLSSNNWGTSNVPSENQINIENEDAVVTVQTALSAENISTTVTHGEETVTNVEKADGTVFAAGDTKKWCAYKFEIKLNGGKIKVEVLADGKTNPEPQEKEMAVVDGTAIIGVTATGVENLTSIAVTTAE